MKASAVHQPDHGRAIIVLPENVGVAIAVEVADAHGVPARSRVRQSPGSNDAGAVHQPDHRCAVTVLPENVGLAVAVEVAGPRDAASLVRDSGEPRLQ